MTIITTRTSLMYGRPYDSTEPGECWCCGLPIEVAIDLFIGDKWYACELCDVEWHWHAKGMYKRIFPMPNPDTMPGSPG